MADEVKPTPEAEVNNTAAAPAEETKETPEAETPREETVGEALETTPPKKPESKPETVPVGAFLQEKKDRKEAERQLRDLQASIAEGATRSEISADVESIVKQYPDVDPKFINSLVAAATAAAEAKMGDKLKPIEEREREERVNRAFDQGYQQAIAKMPEFKDIANPEVIKTLSLDPRNRNKTFTQIIEETYGRVVPGRRTVETTVPGGGKEPESVDMARAKTDPAYFSEIMKNPTLKKQYNEGLAQRINL